MVVVGVSAVVVGASVVGGAVVDEAVVGGSVAGAGTAVVGATVVGGSVVGTTPDGAVAVVPVPPVGWVISGSGVRAAMAMVTPPTSTAAAHTARRAPRDPGAPGPLGLPACGVGAARRRPPTMVTA
jgi:hypothetical protein